MTRDCFTCHEAVMSRDCFIHAVTCMKQLRCYSPSSDSANVNPSLCAQGLRTAQHTLAGVLRHMPLLGTATGEPCKVHVEATYYRVGEEEVHAARRGASIEQVRRCIVD